MEAQAKLPVLDDAFTMARSPRQSAFMDSPPTDLTGLMHMEPQDRYHGQDAASLDLYSSSPDLSDIDILNSYYFSPLSSSSDALRRAMDTTAQIDDPSMISPRQTQAFQPRTVLNHQDQQMLPTWQTLEDDCVFYSEHTDFMGKPAAETAVEYDEKEEEAKPTVEGTGQGRNGDHGGYESGDDAADSVEQDKTRVAAFEQLLPPADPSDWRARLWYCEQAPRKAALDASMVRLLDFPEGIDEAEMEERRKANLRFDRVREQRLKDRNNEAAKRSRQRKVQRIEAAERQVAELRAERDALYQALESERAKADETSNGGDKTQLAVRQLQHHDTSGPKDHDREDMKLQVERDELRQELATAREQLKTVLAELVLLRRRSFQELEPVDLMDLVKTVAEASEHNVAVQVKPEPTEEEEGIPDDYQQCPKKRRCSRSSVLRPKMPQ